LAGGLYFYKLTVNNQPIAVKKMLLAK